MPSFFGKGKVSDAVLDDAWRQAMMAGLKPTLACVRAFSETDFRPDLRNFRSYDIRRPHTRAGASSA